MRCSTVQISGSAISQLDGDAVVATVPKEEIRTITLGYNPRSRHPFLQFFTGFVLVVTGLIFLIAAFLIAEAGVFLLQIKSLTFGVPLLPLGLWLMVGAGLWLVLGVFRGRYIFLIVTPKGSRKLFFGESADIREIRDFATRANRDFGYQIDLSIMQTMHVGEDGEAQKSA